MSEDRKVSSITYDELMRRPELWPAVEARLKEADAMERTLREQVLPANEQTKLAGLCWTVDGETRSLSNRLLHALESEGFVTIGDLMGLTVENIRGMRGIGETSVNELRSCAKFFGFELTRVERGPLVVEDHEDDRHIEKMAAVLLASGDLSLGGALGVARDIVKTNRK
jgi:DNA-directed RNA polymerase alpha subunit